MKVSHESGNCPYCPNTTITRNIAGYLLSRILVWTLSPASEAARLQPVNCNNQSQAETEKSLQVSQMMGQTKDQEQQREPAQNWRNRKGGGVSGTQKPDHLAGARTLCRVSQRELEAQRPLSSKGWHLQEPSHLWKCHTWWGWGMLQPPLSLATPLQGLDVQENKRVKKIELPNTAGKGKR